MSALRGGRRLRAHVAICLAGLGYGFDPRSSGVIAVDVIASRFYIERCPGNSVHNIPDSSSPTYPRSGGADSSLNFWIGVDLMKRLGHTSDFRDARLRRVRSLFQVP